eukprot:CAMPEP_0170466364 /NCGR_PEP_ID=MMETSP0123-20130129/10353_1 /TAXON_ID=182087 /ORGANISM="Favella ehrenbergii, Strain Fehren 1" /LENGTH=64 /DNA_ID=CAMNT_0010732477 /DNA_START=293 /DNA_END=487 /DNA_ORIENTATION=+
MIASWDQKVDAMMALAVFAPDALEKVNDQVKKATKGKMDIYDADKLMHKLLGKKDAPVGFDLFN